MDERSLKRFSGEDDDAGKMLKRWKAWALAKMLTVKDLQKTQRGPWLFTLLDGKALEACEHLELEALAKEDGDQQVWTLLEQRFPEKEAHDQMGEALGEVFGLAAKDSESMKDWTSRVQETFSRCRRKANVDFPTQARGWIMLHCAGLTEEQKAIVKAKTQGSLDMDTVSAGIRSCFPTFRASSVKARKPTSVMLAEDAADQGASDEVADSEFDDVEAFLAEHNLNQDVLEEAVSETEAAEALEISWKERRSEINRLNKSRQFSAADSSRRSFRVEVAELKRRTKCRKCGRVGHWARECRARTNASGQPLQSGSLNSASSGVSTSKMPSETLFDQIYFVGAAEEEVMAASLVSSPGHGVVDSGCGKTLIGEETLRAMEPLLRGRKVIRSEQKNSFRFGNGALEESTVMARIPVAIQQKTGVVDAAVIKGKAPLLLGRPTLERLGMILNFQEGSALLLGDQVPVKLTRNSAGQLLIDLTQFPDEDSQSPVIVAELFSPPRFRTEAALCQPCEDEGTRVRHTAAEAHWQTGKVERHGGLFATVLARVLAEVNLLVDNPNPIANDAVLTDSAVDSQQRIRLAARQALVASQDCRALRDALRARPRLRRDFESGPLKPQFRPLYAHQPPGGVPGLDPSDVIEVTGNVYGLNDAPFWWWETFDAEARAVGFERSQFDNCVYYFRSGGALTGILGAHVDDSITGGEGSAYEEAIRKLKARFPYRKWRIGSGEFCGVMYCQDPSSFEISYSQKEYAQHLRPVSLSKARAAQKEQPASAREISALRGLNGAANWLANQTRPDIAVQVSMSQQSFPNPLIKDIVYANQMVHRARQYKDVEIKVRAIDFNQLSICMHSDAAWSNAKEDRTQAGYLLAFTDHRLKENESAPWSPFHWRSYRLQRVVPSTLGGEAQAFSNASAVAEWMSLLIAEAKEGSFDLRTCQSQLRSTPIVGITDCKSLFDHDKSDPADLLRAALDLGQYQLSEEATVLKVKKQAREHVK
ncbi:RE1, partial [Symbiodinium pilosum]